VTRVSGLVDQTVRGVAQQLGERDRSSDVGEVAAHGGQASRAQRKPQKI